MGVDLGCSRRTTSSTDAAGSTTRTTSSARSSSSLSVSTVPSRPGSVDTSTLDRTTRIRSLSPPLTPRMDPTPTVARASSPRPPSCVPEPPGTDVSSPVSSAVTRTDSRSAPSTTRRTGRSVLMPPSPSVVTITRSVSTPMTTRRTITITTSRFMRPVREMRSTPPMMVSSVTTRMATSLRLMLQPTPSPGGTYPAAAPSACSTAT
mmetsp:Transcript_31179/g.70511  ORF Transcript_31179/g.70511 Transcript_31179/m.70511 type:complete len:206 (-) Transcript_31179:573-1190(-)